MNNDTKLGQLAPIAGVQKDAVHVPILRAKALSRVYPGQLAHVTTQMPYIIDTPTAQSPANCLIDPFLSVSKGAVFPDEFVWVLPLPGTVGEVSHAWDFKCEPSELEEDTYDECQGCY